MIRRKKKQVDIEGINKRNDFFKQIWKEKPHICESCSKYLGPEPKSYFFDHLIGKNIRKDLEFEKENIFLCCFECHSKKTNGFPTELHKKAIEEAKEKFKPN